MTVNMKPVFIILGGLILNTIVSIPTLAENDANPSIAGGVPFFYYHDLPAAADWYQNKLGLKPVTEEDWVVIFELTPTSFIGLVNASGGSLRPTADKGALLSIETAELEAWWEKLKNVEGINMIHGIEVGANGMIQEFRMYDPEGYIIEFFRWQENRPEAKRYKK